MALVNSSTYKIVKRKRPGVHAKTKTSKSKTNPLSGGDTV